MTIWAAWQPIWLLYDKVSFDGINKIIYVHPEVTALDIRADVYSSWIDWHALYQNSEFLLALRYTGLDPIGGGVFTGDTYFLINGWKLSIDLQKVKVTGVLFSDDYDTAYYTPTMVPQYPATVSSLVTTVSVGGGSSGPTAVQIRQEIDANSTRLSSIDTKVNSLNNGPDATTIAAAVRTNLTPELTHILLQENGLTPTQATMLSEIYALYGLDPTKPLIVTDTSRTAGAGVTQNITSNTTQTTITRV